MLQKIEISNFALIKKLNLDFSKGFSVITGETGSGKSIFLGALNLLLGERADFSLIGPHGTKSVVEATFHLHENQFEAWFKANDVDYFQETIVRREINAQGRSRAFINDIPVSLFVLKDLTKDLLFIHSQHYTHSLRDKNFHREILDELLELGPELNEYKALFKEWKTAKAEFLKKVEDVETAETFLNSKYRNLRV